MLRKHRQKFLATLAGLLSLVCFVGVAAAQERPAALERYDRVCDLLFPRDETYPRLYTIVLRYRPSFSGASQIQISKTEDQYRVVYAHLPEGDATIWEQMTAFSQRTGNYRVEDIAAQIKVKRQVLLLSESDLAGVMRDLQRVTMILPESTIVIDGTRYDLWYENVGETFQMHYSFTDTDFGSKHYLYPLAEWMNKVRQLVRKRSDRTKSAGG